MDWEAQDDAFVAKLLMPEGAKDIPVGAPVAVFVENKARSRRAQLSIMHVQYDGDLE